MFSRHLYLKIILYVILILSLAGAGGWCIFTGQAVIIGLLLLWSAAFQIQQLVFILNRANRRITLFLDALQDGECQHFFPEGRINREELLLNTALNKITTLIDEIKKESQKKEHFYKALLEHTPSGILSWDQKGRILFINQAALQLMDFKTLIHIREIQNRYTEFATILPSALSYKTYNIQIQTAKGPRQLALVKNEMLLRNQTVTLLSLQDIREPLNEKETESWMRLTHVLTHEIMNSIAPVTSLSETLSSYFEKEGEIRNREEITEQVIRKTVKGLAIVKRQGKSLLHFAESYRKLSSLPTPVLHPFGLHELIDNTIQLFQTELNENNIQLKVHFSPEHCTLNADENLLSQVLVNLLKNAIQALQNQSNGQISLSVTQQHQQTTIEIADNGPGIPFHLQKDIFIPFFTTRVSGSGIGLSLSRQIIRKHNGDLTVCSAPGQDTRFTILLPA